MPPGRTHVKLHFFLDALILVLVCRLGAAAELQFDDIKKLSEAVRVAKGGDVLILKMGEYKLKEAITLSSGEGGDSDHPVTIRAESIGGCVLRGETTAFAFKPGVANVVVSGFVFRLQDEAAVKIDGSNHIRVTRCEFRLQESDSFDWVVITGANSHHNRVDRCIFSNKSQPGNFITIDGDSAGHQSQHDRIDHNLFRDIAPRATNEKEAVRIGWSELSLSSGFTILENNYFERCDGDPEIVSIKSCDNTVRNNTIVDSMGSLSLRHGNRSSVHGNVIIGRGREGCGGIRVYGDDHRIYNNYLANLTGDRFDAALAVTNGDADDAKKGGRLSAHFRPRRIEIVNNTLIDNAHSIEIGYSTQGKTQWRKAPQEILFANNIISGEQGELVKIFTPPELCVWKNNRIWPAESAKIGLKLEDDAAAQIADPKLALWREFLVPVADSDSTSSGLPCDYVRHDLIGAARSKSPAIGALEANPNLNLGPPLQESEVGPRIAESFVLPCAIIDPDKSLRKHLESMRKASPAD